MSSFKVLMRVSCTNDKSCKIKKFIIDFGTEENYNDYDDNLFDDLVEPINNILLDGWYVDGNIEVCSFEPENATDIIL